LSNQPQDRQGKGGGDEMREDMQQNKEIMDTATRGACLGGEGTMKKVYQGMTDISGSEWWQ
jgi:hypothetical protein